MITGKQIEKGIKEYKKLGGKITPNTFFKNIYGDTVMITTGTPVKIENFRFFYENDTFTEAQTGTFVNFACNKGYKKGLELLKEKMKDKKFIKTLTQSIEDRTEDLFEWDNKQGFLKYIIKE